MLRAMPLLEYCIAIGMAEKTRCFEILKQPYLCNHLTNFYRTKTKLYVKASSIIVCGKENEGNNLKFWCNMPSRILSLSSIIHSWLKDNQLSRI